MIMLAVISLVFILLYVAVSQKSNIDVLSKMTTTASNKTNLITTHFKIYDYSPSTEVCHKYIIVEPFGWSILAKNGKVYIINEAYDASLGCSAIQTPAVILPSLFTGDPKVDVFKTICLNESFLDLHDWYVENKIPHIKYFDLTTMEKFTILDAVNILVNGTITMTLDKAHLENIKEPVKFLNYNTILKTTAGTSIARKFDTFRRIKPTLTKYQQVYK